MDRTDRLSVMSAWTIYLEQSRICSSVQQVRSCTPAEQQGVAAKQIDAVPRRLAVGQQRLEPLQRHLRKPDNINATLSIDQSFVISVHPRERTSLDSRVMWRA